VYDSNKKCILKAGEPGYTDNPNSLVTTFAGGKAGAHGCILQNKHPQCPLGKYRTEVDTQSGRIEATYNCVQCEAGFTSHMINAASCVLQDVRNASCPEDQYIGGGTHGLCLRCPAGKHSTHTWDKHCADTGILTHVISHTKQTRAPSPSAPTFAPTAAPIAAACSAECDSGHGHDSVQAPCLACKGHMSLPAFCLAYPTITGC
jgi:hypothetical protein